jgi:hypothetical protein
VSKREAYPKKSGLATENSTKFLFRWTPQRGSSGYVPGSASIYIRTFFILGTALFPKEDVRGIAATSSEANPRCIDAVPGLFSSETDFELFTILATNRLDSGPLRLNPCLASSG